MADAKDSGVSVAIGWAILLAIFLVLGWVFWIHNKYEVMNLVRWVRWGELQLILPFVDAQKDIAMQTVNGPITYAQFSEFLRTMPKQQLSVDALYGVSLVVMNPLLWLFSGVMIAMGLWCMFYGPGTHLRRAMKGLDPIIAAQARHFPYVAPFIDFDPSKQPARAPGAPVPADLPPFAEALSPEEWMAYHTIPTLTDRKFDTGAAATAFAKQLGRPWRGWTALPPYRQVLLAAFCLKGARKRKEADVMLGDLAMCWHQGKLQITGKLLRAARGVLRNKKLTEATFAKCNQHAFEATAMIRALATAREEGGVLAPATFVWLRAYDRNLWYPLNNLGRQAFHMEAAGAMCHYKAERLAQRPIMRPKVEGAVETLTEYMKSYKARPIPELDYKNSKRRPVKQAQGGRA